MCYGICKYENQQGECILGILEIDEELPKDAGCYIEEGEKEDEV